MTIGMTGMKMKALLIGATAFAALTGQAGAEMRPTLNFYGVSGLIDMPSAEAQSDGRLSLVRSQFGPVTRTTLSFQITPRLSGSFRYTGVKKWNEVVAAPFATYFDRSFDLRYQLLTEGTYLPAVTVGLQDIIGTGQFAGEYLVATKTFDEKLKVSAGLGWGRFGSYGSIGSPFGDRPAVDFGNGGKPRLGQWFKGNVAPFAGIEYKYSDRWTFKAEYSSDNYTEESSKRKTFDRKTPFNFGAEYTGWRGIKFGLYSLYGSTVGFSAQLSLDPYKSAQGGQKGAGPLPVRASAAANGWSSDWVTDKGALTRLRDQVQVLLNSDGIVLESLSVQGNTAQLRLRNPRLDNGPQAIGRAARALANVMPSAVQRFEIVPIVQGVPVSRVVINRADLEDLEFAAGQDKAMLNRIEVLPVAGGRPLNAVYGDGLYPKFKWGIAPYLQTGLFDPFAPVQVNIGLRATASYEVAPGMVFSGSVIKKIVGNIGKNPADAPPPSDIPRVRSEAYKFAAQGDPAIERLTFAWYAKPAENLYSRVTVGYLEPMFGGVSAELLWKQVDKPYAFGVEVNYVKQRNYDQLFGFQDYSTLTGHVSAYYAFDNGFHAQLDVGRYLAKDVGATFMLDREFANGIKVGAFATLTNMSFDDFGEGSFDKGIRVTIPMSFLSGRPTQKTTGIVLRPIVRDGGAKLDVDGRLYDATRQYQRPQLDKTFGRFWK